MRPVAMASVIGAGGSCDFAQDDGLPVTPAMGGVVGRGGSCDCAQDDGLPVTPAMGSVIGVGGSCDFAQDDGVPAVLGAVASLRHFAPRVILRAVAGSTPATTGPSMVLAF